MRGSRRCKRRGYSTFARASHVHVRNHHPPLPPSATQGVSASGSIAAHCQPAPAGHGGAPTISSVAMVTSVSVVFGSGTAPAARSSATPSARKNMHSRLRRATDDRHNHRHCRHSWVIRVNRVIRLPAQLRVETGGALYRRLITRGVVTRFPHQQQRQAAPAVACRAPLTAR